jgi:hypothetical protein
MIPGPAGNEWSPMAWRRTGDPPPSAGPATPSLCMNLWTGGGQSR